MRLLLAEDEQELSNALATILRHEHYTVDTVYNGQDALDYGLSTVYDGIILDIMMPRMDGIAVLSCLRAKGISSPVLMLTAKAQVDDRILGLNKGADDYLGKPFVMGELLARVRAMTRRVTEFVPDMLTFGTLRLNRNTFELCNGEHVVHLSNKEYQMMEMLIQGQSRLITTEQFMQRVWGYDSDAEINIVWVYISYLRRKLSSLGAAAEIAALRGRGYMLKAVEQ